jgi:hypothetical protein
MRRELLDPIAVSRGLIDERHVLLAKGRELIAQKRAAVPDTAPQAATLQHRSRGTLSHLDAGRVGQAGLIVSSGAISRFNGVSSEDAFRVGPG